MSTGVKIFGWEALYFSSELKFIRILRLTVLIMVVCVAPLLNPCCGINGKSI